MILTSVSLPIVFSLYSPVCSTVGGDGGGGSDVGGGGSHGGNIDPPNAAQSRCLMQEYRYNEDSINSNCPADNAEVKFSVACSFDRHVVILMSVSLSTATACCYLS